jgi:hypothetical protein
MALTLYQALRIHHTKLDYTMDNNPNTVPSPAQHANKHTAVNDAPSHHMSSTVNTLEQEGTFRAPYTAITKTKPPHDSSHTTSSSNNNKPRQMICSKAHQGDANKTPKWIIIRKDPKPPYITFANFYRARARAAAGKPPEEIEPVNKLKQQWEVLHMGWGNPKSNIEPSNPKHPNYVAPSPDKHKMKPHPGHFFGQSAHQSTDDDDESIQDDTYDVNNSEEEDTYKFAEGGHY